jgi:predicted small lipoprotein YifL
MGEYPVTHYRLIASCAVLAAVAALALAGCGRKGGLEMPPSAVGQPVTQQSQQRIPGRPEPGVTHEGQAIAPRGERKPVPPLDWLID